MKLFNNHSGSRGLPRFIKEIYWATSLFLRTPFTEGVRELIRKPRPLAVNNVALLVPLRSVQFSLAVREKGTKCESEKEKRDNLLSKNGFFA